MKIWIGKKNILKKRLFEILFLFLFVLGSGNFPGSKIVISADYSNSKYQKINNNNFFVMGSENQEDLKNKKNIFNTKNILRPDIEKIKIKEKIDKEKEEIKKKEEEEKRKKLEKIKKGRYLITGYQALPAQTDSSPNIAAWNDDITGGVNVIAVVQDSPFKRGTCIKISGLEETYIVLDRLNKRYNGKRKIDVLVGSRKKAFSITGIKNIQVLPIGSCDLKRIIDGEIRYEKLSKKRFRI